MGFVQWMLSLDLSTALVLRLLGLVLESVLEIANHGYGPCQWMFSLCLVPLLLSITSRFLSIFSFKILLSFNFFTESLVCEPAKFEQSPSLATHRSVLPFHIPCSFAFRLLPPH